MKTFTLFWRDGKSQIIDGANLEAAITKAGYGGGAMRALDFWANGDETAKYTWNKETRNWDKVPEQPAYEEAVMGGLIS